MLLEACVRIAPKSRIIACDMFYRKNIPDTIVDESNAMLKAEVQETNRIISEHSREEEQHLTDGRKFVSSRCSRAINILLVLTDLL